MFYNDARIGMMQGDLHKADDEDGSWITMNGTHVHMKDGEVDKGPQKVKDHVSANNEDKRKASEPKELPKLQGSEKQVQWGEKMRAGFQRSLEPTLKEIERDGGKKQAELAREAAHEIMQNSSAKYWLENKGMSGWNSGYGVGATYDAINNHIMASPTLSAKLKGITG